MNLKKENLIEGKIYKVYQQKEFKYLVKKDNGNNYICLNPRKLENSFLSKGFISSTSYDYELATPEESHWLEECIKANKFIPKEEALKSFKQEFKAGDYIVCLDKPSTSYPKEDNNGTYGGASGGAGYKANFCYEIKRVSKLYGFNVLWGGNNNNGIYYTSVRYATKEEIAEYDRLGKPYDVTTITKVPERISFYVMYNTEFTEDLYNKAIEWCKANCSGKIRGFADSYEGLQSHKFFLFDNCGIRSNSCYHYGVDNNKQDCIKRISINELKEIIGYKQQNINFEVGKWYKSNIGDKDNNWFYLKVTKINSNYNIEGQLLEQDKSFKENWSWNDRFTIEQALELGPLEDLSEIQQYLSDNHPDQVKSLVGRYVKALIDYPASGSVRIGEIGIVTKNIGSNKLRVDFPSQSNYSIDKWHFDKKRVELLPRDYKPESEEWIPKVGDWIYILDTGGIINRNNDLEINKAYKISKLHNEKCGDINADLEGLKDRIRIKDGCITFGDHSKLYRKALDHEIPKCSTSVGEIKYSDTSGLVVDNTKPMEANWSIGTTTKFEDVPLSDTITVNGQFIIYGTGGYGSSQITFSKHIPKTIKPITLDSKPNDLILGVKPNYPKQIKKIVL